MTLRHGGVRAGSWLLAIALAAAAVRLVAIDQQGLWVDEVFSLAMATGHSLEHSAKVADPRVGDFVEASHPLPARVLRRYAEHDRPAAGPRRVVRAVLLSDTSPPLYYLLLNGWLRLAGTGDVSLRMYSLIWAMACVPLLWAVARQTAGPGAAVTASALFAFAPMAVHYSIEGRMYSQLWFVTLATTCLALRAREEGSSARTVVALTAVSAAGLLTHYFYAFVWLATWCWMLRCPGRLNRRLIILIGAVAAALVMPWYIAALASLDDWRVTQGWLNSRPQGYRYLAVPIELALNLFSNVPGARVPLPPLRWAAPTVAVAAFALWRWRAWIISGPRVLLWASVGAACVGPLIFDLGLGTYSGAVPRYALAGLPAALLLVAAGLYRLQVPVQALVVTAFVIGWMPGLWRIHTEAARGSSPLREVAAELRERSREGDVLVIDSIPSGAVGLARYLDPSTPVAVRIGVLDRHVGHAELAALLASRRVFLAKVRPGRRTAPHEDFVRQNASLAEEIRFRNSTLLEFVPRATPPLEIDSGAVAIPPVRVARAGGRQ
jgi:hypothetical protein